MEGDLQQLQLSGRGQDAVRWPVRLGGQLNYLADGIAESDFAPTAQQREAFESLHRRLGDVKARFDAVVSGDVAGFNRALAQAGVAGVVMR